MQKAAVSRPTLGRLPSYLNYLNALSTEKVPYISATTIAKELNLGEVQVRKDLAAVSGAGKPKLGYVTQELIEKLEECLGHNNRTLAVLVGAGRLGRALLQYGGFERYGVKIAAAFDTNERVFDFESETRILPVEELEPFCAQRDIKLGIITVGAGAAQIVCDQMVKSGITAIWNFAPCKLTIPDGVLIQNEDLALSLAFLSNQMNQSGGTEVCNVK